MAQDLTPKLVSIAGDSTVRAKALLQAIEGLMSNSGILEQSGGNFPDGIFDTTNLNYLSAYQMNVFLQIVVPAVDAFLDTNIQGDSAQPTFREAFQTAVSGSY